jgi:hypothetical protein
MGHRFEFDPVNKVLLLRVAGPLTDEALAEGYRAIRRHSAATNPSAGIFDFTAVTDFPVSTEFIRQMAKNEPAIPSDRPRALIASQTHAFGLLRMFQIMGEQTRPNLHVVRTLDEAFEVLGIQSPHFEPLD